MNEKLLLHCISEIGDFSGELIADARKELAKAVEDAGYDYIMPEESIGRYGAVETIEEESAMPHFWNKTAGNIKALFCACRILVTKTAQW